MAFPLSKLVGLMSLFGVITAVPVADRISLFEKRDVADAGVDEGYPMLGFRCPYPPDENGRWPDYCHDVIGSECQCMYDDIHLSQVQCLWDGRQNYEAMLRRQMALERERDSRRRDEGLPIRREPYEHLWNCYSKIKDLVLHHASGTNGSDGSDETPPLPVVSRK